jgi:N-acetyl sugar amidotransferase
MKRCINCVIPETQDAITFDKEGVCDVCRNNQYKNERIDWQKKEKEFIDLISPFRNKGQYDCIIPFSGGKDSTFQAYTLIRKFKLKPLIVSFDHGFFRTSHLDNVDKTLRKLGADYLKFRPNWKIVKKLMLESLKRKGDFCWHCHTGIYAYPMQIAVKFKIPLIIWGESVAEYMSFYNFEEEESVDEKRFHKCCNLGITSEDMLGMLNDPTVEMRDLEPFVYPDIKDLKGIGYKSICLGSYVKWNPKEQSKLIEKELGWKGNITEGVPPGYEYEKNECILQGVRDYLKYIKRGFSRASHLASIDIRNGEITREKAMEMVRRSEGKRPASLDIFLKMLDLTEAEFNEIAIKHMITPYVHDFEKSERGGDLPDQQEWMGKEY